MLCPVQSETVERHVCCVSCRMRQSHSAAGRAGKIETFTELLSLPMLFGSGVTSPLCHIIRNNNDVICRRYTTFIVANPQQQHVSAKQSSRHQAVCIRNCKKKVI